MDLYSRPFYGRMREMSNLEGVPQGAVRPPRIAGIDIVVLMFAIVCGVILLLVSGVSYFFVAGVVGFH